MLSYESSKCVLQNLNLDTRGQIDRQIPSLQKLNSTIPFTLDYVNLESRGCWRINDMTWFFHDKKIKMWRNEICLKKPIEIPKNSGEKLYEKINLYYLRKGTKIRSFHFRKFPDCLLDQFRNLQDHIVYCEKVVAELFDVHPFLEEPWIKSASELSLSYHEFLHQPVQVYLLKLQNRHIHLEWSPVTFHVQRQNFEWIPVIVEHWKATNRPIGSTLTAPILENGEIKEIIDNLKIQIPSAADSEIRKQFSNFCVTIPVNAESEIVVYSGLDNGSSPANKKLALKIEVMSKGATVPK